MNLKEGQVIKNYIELCKLLEVEPTQGKGRKYHIRELERYCKYKKEGHKFIIKEVFDEPSRKIDKRSGNGKHFNKYDNLMDNILINLLIDNDGKIEESLSWIMKQTDLLTERYIVLNKSGYKNFAKANKLGVGLTQRYQQQIFNIVRKLLETSLNRLNRQGIITYRKRVLMKNFKLNHKIADKQTEIKIKLLEDKVYKKMGIEYGHRINPEVNRRFKNRVSRQLNIMTYYNIYCFKLVDTDTKKVTEDKEELIKRLIKSVVEQVKKHKSINHAGEIYYPYSFQKYEQQIEKLNELLWNIPDGHQNMIKFKIINSVKNIEYKYKEYEKEDDVLIYESALPF